MTDITTQTAAESTAKNVLGNMASRSIFDTTAQALAYLTKASTDFADFATHPLAIVGLNAEGDFDPAIYNDDMRVAVAVLTQRGEGPNSSTVKAIVAYPSPKLDAILATETGKAWLTGIMEKELNHVAVRNLRKAETQDEIKDAIATAPTTVEGYTTSGTEATGGILETYNTLWQTIKKTLAAKSKAFALANLSKKELRKALESASYAAATYPVLENRTNKAGEKESLFEIAARFGVALAAKESLDGAFFANVLNTRNEKTIELADDEGEFDLDAMAAAVTAESAEESSEDDATKEQPAA